MKITEIKKALKTGRIEVRSVTKDYGIISTWVLIKYHDNYGLTTLARIEAQANDLTYKDHKRDDLDEKPNCNKHDSVRFLDYSGFYALHANAKIDLRERYDQDDSPTRLLNIMKLVNSVIDAKNLSFVYPECQLSQFIAALEILGCSVGLNEINYEDAWKWKEQRAEQWHKRREEKQQMKILEA